ncbi:MAG: transporter ATP-binding protein [Marmoricola sp.]|nr:transporter ATP-binding protein [Marmoricola sp.]MCW2837946.1 transporter ATP-binding protein [Marmoricola sp.]
MNDSDERPLVQATSVGVSYGQTDILHGVALTVCPGAHVAVMGRSGSGKTTLLLTLAGLLAPSSGTVTWPGLSPDVRRRRGEIGMIFQAPSLMPELTALQNTTLPLRLRGVGVEEARDSSLVALAAIGAADLADALPAQLSGGQQQRVAIARALAGRHRLVLADEPTGALDRARARQVALALRDAVAATGGGLVLATHDPALAEMFDEHLTVLDGDLTLGRTA